MRSSSEPCSRSSICRFARADPRRTRWRNSAVSSSNRSGDSTPLTTTLRASMRSRASSSAESSLPVKTTTGRSRSASRREWFPAPRSRSCRAGADRARRSRTAARAARSAPPFPFSAVVMSMSSCAEQRRDALQLAPRLSSTTSSRLRRGAANALMRDSATLSPSAVVGLPTNEKAPRASPC